MKKLQLITLSNRPKLVLPGVHKIIIEFLDQIYYCEADDSYTRLYLESGTSYLTSYTLKELEMSLEAYHFIRCHRSYMVNALYVKEINKSKNSITLVNTRVIPISQSYRQNFLSRVFQCSNQVV